MPDAHDYVLFYLGGVPFTAQDLGDDLLDEDIRTLFQTMIDRNMVPGVEPGSPWYEHIRLDRMERIDQELKEDVLVDSLIKDRRAAEAAYAADKTEENRQRVTEAHKRVQMATKLVAD